MLNICFTFDYELFFGKNYGSYDEILFEPTNRLVNMLTEEQTSATFFADACSVTQSKKYNQVEYVDKFTKQIQELYKKKQDIQLHIHSHWLKSSYNNGAWEFDKDSYRIHSFGFERNQDDNAYGIIKKGVEYLASTLKEINPNYCCIAYRAGGFTIQPHEKLIDTLYDCGIRVDSSIAPGLKSCSLTNSYDYTHSITNENWKISSKREWWEDSTGDEKTLYEIPIATENKNPLFFTMKRIFLPNEIKLKLGEKKGSYINESGDKNIKSIEAIWKYVSGYNAISMDAYNAEYIFKMLRRYYQKHNCKEKDCTVAIIGHPKLVNDVYIENLRRLILMIRGDRNIKIMNIMEAYNNIGEK